jgi:single-strand DNA-binding protein
MIKLQIIGHLGKDAIVNNVNGKQVINFTVAHTEKWKDAQGVVNEKTTWVDCAWWSDRNGVVPFLKKGKQVYVEGIPEARAFSRNDGSAGASLSLKVREVQLLGGADNSQQGNAQAKPANTTSAGGADRIPNANEITEPIDDLPF